MLGSKDKRYLYRKIKLTSRRLAGPVSEEEPGHPVRVSAHPDVHLCLRLLPAEKQPVRHL